jgi:GT2 family glycosyltransferase
MAVRMSQTTPQVADSELTEETPGAPLVRILITGVPGADLEAALAVVGRQVYEPSPQIAVIGEGLEVPDGVATSSSLEEAINSTDSTIDYLWILHADARPRPDALSALIAEIERNEASLAGSKLLKAGTPDELESVGGATDVFGEPYSGLDEGEIDLQQYDVVREVAFVQSASMLVRRDLAQGLRGLDPLLPPVASGLDFSQRTRLAGGKVISVPSSEVYHQGRCFAPGSGWREQAGRLRAMLTAYSPLTLLWVVPYDLLVSFVDSIISLLMLRWRPLARHVMSWLWNLYHLPSTISQRRRLRSVRSEGDEELFRFHAKGSVRLRAIGEEISGRVLSVFDDDQALARGSRRVFGSPGIWGAALAALVVILSARTIIFIGMPDVGFAFPFEPPSIAFQRWFGGWNEAGLGSAHPVHPSVGLTGLSSLLMFGSEGAARTVLTLVLAIVGVVGFGRLGGRLGLRGPGRYLAGLVLLAGPGTALLVGRGSWLALAAAALLPWAVRAAFIHPGESRRGLVGRAGWALLTGLLLAALSPLLAVVPLLTVLVWRALGGTGSKLLLAATALAGSLAGVAFVIGDLSWVTDPSLRLNLTVSDLWPAAVAVIAIPFVLDETRLRTMALTGGLLSVVSLAIARVVPMAPGVQEAVLVLASFGAGMAVAAALDGFSRNPVRLVASLAAIAVVVVSAGTLMNGRLGLPSGDVNDRLGFASTLAGEDGPGRILFASTERALVPGQATAGPGFWYRVVDGTGMTHDEVWLPTPGLGEEQLARELTDIASGTELRPGRALADFAIDWVVLEGPTFVLDDALLAQLDLVPTPLDPASRVYENSEAAPLAGTPDDPWTRDGTGFSGTAGDSPVPLAIDFAPGWEPDGTESSWATVVSGEQGRAWYSPTLVQLALPLAVIAGFVAALGLIGIGSRRP